MGILWWNFTWMLLLPLLQWLKFIMISLLSMIMCLPVYKAYLTMHTLEDGRGGWTACTTLNQCNPFPKSADLQVVIQSSSVKAGLGGTKQSSHQIIISGTNVHGIDLVVVLWNSCTTHPALSCVAAWWMLTPRCRKPHVAALEIDAMILTARYEIQIYKSPRPTKHPYL